MLQQSVEAVTQDIQVQRPHTVIVCWGEDEHPAKPVGTITRLGLSPERAVAAAKEWCQAQANSLAQDVLPLLQWQRFLSLGRGPGTAHYVASCPDGTFEIWIVGELS